MNGLDVSRRTVAGVIASAQVIGRGGRFADAAAAKSAAEKLVDDGHSVARAVAIATRPHTAPRFADALAKFRAASAQHRLPNDDGAALFIGGAL